MNLTPINPYWTEKFKALEQENEELKRRIKELEKEKVKSNGAVE